MEPRSTPLRHWLIVRPPVRASHLPTYLAAAAYGADRDLGHLNLVQSANHHCVASYRQRMAAQGASNGRRGARKRKCASYSVFEKNVNRSRAFIRVFDGDTPRKRGKPTNDEVELLRGSVVFAVGALDSFMTDLILELVPKFGGNAEAMGGPLKEIAKAEPALALRVALSSKTDAQNEFRSALSDWIETKSFHGVAKIMNGIKYIGVTLDDSILPEGWQKTLDQYTEMRHQIVHRGDTSTVRLENARECAELIEALGQSINKSAVKLYH